MDVPIAHAHAERIGDDLLVTWRGGGPDVAVFVSDTPDDAGVDLREPDRPGRIVVRGVDPAIRPFVHLLAGDGPFVVVAERLIPLEGALNFRDVGGYRGAGGRQVRWGRVFRSDHLGDLTEADELRLAQLGVQLVVDYRGPAEHEATPSRIVEGHAIVRHDRPISDGEEDGKSLWTRIMDGSLPAFGPDDLARYYARTIATSAPIFGEVLTMAANAEHHAMVFHCTAGKDRTGLTAALLLGALGVDEGDILDDYELSNRYRGGRRVEETRPMLAEQGIDIEQYLALFTAPRPALATALAELRATHGSIEGYLREVAGVDPAVLDALRATMLV